MLFSLNLVTNMMIVYLEDLCRAFKGVILRPDSNLLSGSWTIVIESLLDYSINLLKENNSYPGLARNDVLM